jgi:4-hydroxyacetophenone monooxygenase
MAAPMMKAAGAEARSDMISQELRSASDATIEQALAFADPLILTALLYHGTGDESLAALKIDQGPGFLAEAPTMGNAEDIAKVRAKALELLRAYRDGRKQPPTSASRDHLQRAMSLAVGQRVRDEDLDFWLEELALEPVPRQFHWRGKPDPERLKNFRVAVIGAGYGGINAAIQLKLAGYDYAVFEKNPGVGGTWHANRYPGARVDVASTLYSHTFAVNYPFQHLFAPQSESERYANWCVDRFDVREHLHLGTEVTGARWDDASGTWTLGLRHSNGSEELYVANAIIMAVGFLDRPQLPDIPGIESFKGRIFHTTNFRADLGLDLSGERVGVIGTGSSGMQMVPDLAPKVGHLTIFQRSPAWVVPAPGYRDPLARESLWLNSNVPYYNNWKRFISAWLMGDPCLYEPWSVDPHWRDEHTVNELNHRFRQRLVEYLEQKLDGRPDLKAKTLPKYPPLAKRFVVDNGWFDALKRPNVALNTDGIAKFTATGIETTAGEAVALDTVVFATGFRANQYFWPMQIQGRDGATPQKLWAKDGARAYWGINIPGLPNLFCVYGPNTNPKNGTPISSGESQTRYALTCLGELVRNGWKSLDVRLEAYETFNQELDRRLASTIWMDKRQRSYYQNEAGRSATNMPWASIEYWRRLKTIALQDYDIDTGETAGGRASRRGARRTAGAGA